MRVCSDHASRKEAVVATDRRVPHDRHAVFQSRSAAKANMRAYHAMMPDSNIVIQFGSGINHGGMSDDGWHVSKPLSIVK